MFRLKKSDAQLNNLTPSLRCGLIILFGIIAFAATLKLGFLWDDHQMLEQNPYIKTINIENIKHLFLSDPFNQQLNYYRPLQSLSNMIEYPVWKLNPSGYHLVNLAIHCLTACLVFYLVCLLGYSLKVGWLTAILFAVNPIVVEQLIIIAGRAELMASFFILLSVIFFFKTHKAAYSLSLLAFALALLSKENGVITPLSIALIIIYRKESFRKMIYLIPYFVLILPYFILRNYAVGNSLGKYQWGDIGSFLIRFPQEIWYYLFNTLLPLNLHSHRLAPELSLLSLCLLVFSISLAVYFYQKKQRIILFGIAWYILLLSPKIPLLIVNTLMLDHWAYLSNVGLFLPLAFFSIKSIKNDTVANPIIRAQAPRLIVRTETKNGKIFLHQNMRAYPVRYVSRFWDEKMQPFFVEFRKQSRCLGHVSLAGLILFYIMVANYNIHIRGTDLKIYEQAARFTTSRPLYYNLAREYLIQKDYNKALKYFEILKARNPQDKLVLRGLALTLLYLNRKGEALKVYEEILAIDPENVEALLNSGSMLAEKKDYQKAKYYWERVLAIEKNNIPAKQNLIKLEKRVRK